MRGRLWIVVCVLLSARAAEAPAQAQQQPAQEPERVCPISDNRFSRAQDIFKRIADVMRNPRCINCHGDESPFQKDSIHPTDAYELKKNAQGEVDDATFAPCQKCHGGLRDWKVPPSDMDFTGKDSTALCKLLKSKEDLGKNLVDHFDHDRGGVQFIEEAFKGTRGLNAEGQADVGDVPLPIRGITHKEFTQLGKDWLAALGSGDGRIGFHDGDCGCVQHHYALKIHSEVTVAAGPVSVDNNTAARDPVIPIVFNDDRTFSTKPGTATDPLKIGFPLPCVASGVSMISVSATGSFSNQPTVINLSDGTQSEETEALLVMLTGTPQLTEASVVCPRPLPSGAGASVGGQGSLNFVLETWIGTSSPLESLPWFKPFPMVQSAASIAVVKVD